MKVVIDYVEVEINEVKIGGTFSPEHKINMNRHQFTNGIIYEVNESSVVNIQSVKDKLNKLNEIQKYVNS